MSLLKLLSPNPEVKPVITPFMRYLLEESEKVHIAHVNLDQTPFIIPIEDEKKETDSTNDDCINAV